MLSCPNSVFVKLTMDEEENNVFNLKVGNLVCYSLAGELARFFLWPAKVLYFPPNKIFCVSSRLLRPENSGVLERVNDPPYSPLGLYLGGGEGKFGDV